MCGIEPFIVFAVAPFHLPVMEAAEKVDTTACIWYNVIIKYRLWHYG